ncbi:MAG: protein kinase, partial [Verrucomicrobia bacterium]|nr:protein kinase [Verrucomicrobiota bacterium]
HRDIKPSNMMVSWEDGRLENVKIIDLGLAKGVTEDSLSIAGSFIGTPTYASPEQFAGLGTDIRSDLYSLGVTLWEMLSGKPPFHGLAAELMDQHQHAAPPIEKLKGIPEPVIALLQVLLAKDSNQRFQTPAQLQKALTRVREAIASGSKLTADELRSAGELVVPRSPKAKPRKQTIRWLLGAGGCLAILLIAWFFLFGHSGFLSNQQANQAVAAEKSIAVLPFESLSENKSDGYFADGVQDEILNNLAKIAQLTVISRTSVMQYRGDAKRDLRQIANALGVANILEGTVRHDGSRVRVSIELIDARNDRTIWADSYDRDLSDIFAIQSDVAQTIASKLTATLSPGEKKSIEQKPTENLEAYDLYLRANELISSSTMASSKSKDELLEAVVFLEKAVRSDPNFALAYCASAHANNLLYWWYDQTPERLALVDAAVTEALRLQPDLPEAHLAMARYLYHGYRNYDGARVQLAIAKRGLPNSIEITDYEAYIDRRQGNMEKAIAGLKAAVARDPKNQASLQNLADTLVGTRQFDAAAPFYDRLIELRPDRLEYKFNKAFTRFYKTGDLSAVSSAIAALPKSADLDPDALDAALWLSLVDRDWTKAEQLIERMGSREGGYLSGYFSYSGRPTPAECYSVLMARLRKDQPEANQVFAEIRKRLNLRVLEAPQDALLLSSLAVLDGLLNRKEAAISEAKRATNLLPISKDAFEGPQILKNLAVVYAWTGDLDLAFETLGSLTKIPFGIFYGDLKRDPQWEPLRQDPRYEKLLAELAPRD